MNSILRDQVDSTGISRQALSVLKTLRKDVIKDPTILYLGGRHELDIRSYEVWYMILKLDLINDFEIIMQNCSNEEKCVLLNASFKYHPSVYFAVRRINIWYMMDHVITDILRNMSLHGNPIMLVIAFRSRAIFNQMVKMTGIVNMVDTKDQNILHVMVFAARALGLSDEKYIEYYNHVMTAIDLDSRRALLMQENMNGYRPVELAAMTGSYHLVYAMMNENDVYRVKGHHHGLLQEVYYDVSEYECERLDKSPIYLLSNSIIMKLKDPAYTSLLETPLIKAWCHKKYTMNHPLLVIWFIWRMVFCAAFCFVDVSFEFFGGVELIQGSKVINDGSNSTKHCHGTLITLNNIE